MVGGGALAAPTGLFPEIKVPSSFLRGSHLPTGKIFHIIIQQDGRRGP